MSKSANSSRQSRRAVQLVAALVVAASALAACGDDDKNSDGATHDEWFDAACETIGGDQSGFPEFTAAHPDASLAEWAEFLPTPIAFLDRIIAAAKLPHPAEDDAGLAATTAVVERVQASWQTAIDAANAGDDGAFDEAMGEAQAGLGEMDAAMKAVDPRDCPGFEG